ncbi:MAG: DegT/DnrJ/EryC1/StrS aminotransferase family protein [Spirochaetia bacterium]|jgi:dTDP-4-amino-4,6-dideoxygalactose transaminase
MRPVSKSAGLPPVPFARPSLGSEEEEAVLAVMRSGWLTTGEVTARFEAEFAKVVGARHALALNSATAGLHLALEALGVGPGSVVLTTPYTFAATAEVVRYLGADPQFVDIDPTTMNMNPAGLEAALDRLRQAGRRVSAIIPVHVAGLPCDMDAIHHLSLKHGVPIVEDAAHSFPVRYGGRYVGTLGDAGVYSFYATKTITTGEGGMVVTDRDDVAKRIRVMRLHGIDREIWNRYTEPGASWKYDVVAPGYKYNLSDLASAIGRVQLQKAESFLQKRKAVARRYIMAFGGLDFLNVPSWTEDHAWHLFIARLRPEKLSITRDAFIEEMQNRGIGVSVHFIPLHTMTYYRDRYGLKPDDFPVSYECFKRCISLPIPASLTDDEVERVIAAVAEIGGENRS